MSVSSPNLCVEVLIPSAMVCGGGASGRSLGSDRVLRMGSSRWNYCPYKKRKRHKVSPLLSCHVRIQQEGSKLSPNQEEASHL